MKQTKQLAEPVKFLKVEPGRTKEEVIFSDKPAKLLLIFQNISGLAFQPFSDLSKRQHQDRMPCPDRFIRGHKFAGVYERYNRHETDCERL